MPSVYALKDPSKTTGLRMRFIRDMDRRFAELKRAMRISIVDNDCFGIQPSIRTFELTPAPRKAFEFKRTPEKIKGFMAWLEEQEAKGVLQVIRRPGTYTGIEAAWSDLYIDSAYQQGMRNGRTRLRRQGAKIPTFDEGFHNVAAAMNQPIHADRVGIIYTRVFEDLKSVMNVTNAQIRRELTEGLTSGLAKGMAEGKNPNVIAREMFKDAASRVDKIGIVRARTIARSEVMNAHNEASLAEYEMAQQIMGVPVMVEVAVGGGPCKSGICDDVAADAPFTIEEARGMWPGHTHPNCGCVPLPIVGEPGETHKDMARRLAN